MVPLLCRWEHSLGLPCLHSRLSESMWKGDVPAGDANFAFDALLLR